MSSRDAQRGRVARAADAALIGVLAAFAAVLGFAVWSVRRTGSDGLGDAVLGNLERTGVESPVTGVLMNFRAYDTLLELAVLFLALLGVWSFGRSARPLSGPPPVVLSTLNQLLVPFLILFAAYLLWAGSQGSGGAFQAGAVVAAAGVLIALSGGLPLRGAHELLERVLIVLGVSVFAAVAAGVAGAGGALLEYPPAWAKGLILLIEAAATVSIGLTLLAAFLGGRPRVPNGEADGDE